MRLALVSTSFIILSSTSTFANESICGESDANSAKSKTFVSLGFASQSFSSPVSMFGHTFLIFHSETIPEPDAVVIEFTGVTEGRSLPSMEALIGTLPGRFRYTCFDLKKQEYDQENRDIWIYPLVLNVSERERLNQKASSLSSKWPNYGFLRGNCADRVFLLILEIFQESPPLQIVHVPVDGMKYLSARGHLRSDGVLLPSSFRLLLDSYQRLNSGEKVIFERHIGGTSQNSINSKVQETISRYVNYKIRREPDHVKRLDLFNLKKQSRNTKAPITGIQNPIEESRHHLLQFGLLVPNSLQLSFSPGMKNFWNPGSDSLKASTIEFARFEASVSPYSTIVQRVSVLSIDSFGQGNAFDTPLARYIDLRYVDWKVWYGSPQKSIDLRFGLGFSYNINQSFSIGLTPLVSGGYYENGSDALYGVQVGFRIRSNLGVYDYFRIGLTIESFVYRKERFGNLIETTMAIPLDKTWTLGAIARVFDLSYLALSSVVSIRF